MTITQVRLVDGEREMILLPRDGLSLRSLDVPYPAVREVTEVRTGTDGEQDDSLYHAGRAVSAELLATKTLGTLADEVKSFLHPSARPFLYVEDDEWAQERRLKLRADQASDPITNPIARELLVQWKAPDGVWESAQETTVVVGADVPPPAGMTFTGDPTSNLVASDLSGWAGVNGTIAADQTVASASVASFRYDSDTAVTGTRYANYTTGVSVTAGETYELFSAALAGATFERARIDVEWLDSAAAQISVSQGVEVALSSEPARIALTVTAPTGAVTAHPRVVFTPDPGATAAHAFADVAQMEVSGDDGGVTITDEGLVMAGVDAAGVVNVIVSGTVPLHFVARLYGPCTAPQLTLDNTGESIVFTSELALGSGEYVEIDSQSRTAYLLGTHSLAASRRRFVDFGETTWFRLQPSVTNRLRYHPDSGVAGGTAAHVFCRNAWL